MTLWGDKAIGPQAKDRDDFTLTFAHLILTIIPVAAFILLCPWVLHRHLRLHLDPEKRGSELLLVFRLIPVGVLFLADLASVGFWSSIPNDNFRPGLALAAAALSSFADLLVAALAFVEYRRCLRSSAVLGIYVSLGVILDGIKTRSYLIRHELPGMVTIGALCAVSAAAKLVLAVLEEIPKRSHLVSTSLRDLVGGEALSGFWGRSLFIWLNSTLRFGFRNVLDVHHLNNLGPDLDAALLLARFRKAWENTDKTSRLCLTKACLGAFWDSFFLIPIPRLLLIGFNFAQPFLLHRVIVSIRSDEEMPESMKNGLIAATFLVFFGTAITTASFTHLTYRFIVQLRSVFVQEIYNKTLNIAQSEAEKNAAVTLMSTEIDNMILGLAQFHDIWAAFVEIGIGTWLLSSIVGKICYLMIPTAFLSTAIAYELGRRMGPARTAWNAYIQVRVAKTANVLAQSKIVKMLGLSRVFTGLTAIMVGSSIFLTGSTPIIVIAGALFWTTFDRHLDANEVFPALTILILVQDPLANILMYYPNVMSTMACVRRMQDYLLLEEVPSVSPAEAARAARHSAAIEKADGVVEIGRRRLRMPLPTRERLAAQFFNAFIAPEKDKSPVLSSVNTNIMRDSLTMVTSPTGAGKTTLLRAIIGGAIVTQGSMHLDPRIAYCAQDPWILNLSICMNIIVWAVLEPAWYHAVVKACWLLEDISNFPGGDQFLADSGGRNLSGGQKMRLSIARAVYTRSTVIVFDDVFASLDRNTAARIFCALFGSSGLLKNTNTTVIMSTSKPTGYLDLATDVVYVHTNGTVTTHTNNKRPNLTDDALIKLLAEKDSVEKETAIVSQRETAVQPANTDIEEEKDALRQSGGKGLYRFYLRSVGWARVVVFFAFIVLSVFTEILPQLLLRIWIGLDPDNMDYFIPFALLSLVGGVVAGFNLFFYWFHFVPKSAESLNRMLADVVMRARLSFLSSTDSGTILNRFSQDMNLLTLELPTTFWKSAYYFLCVVVNVCVLASGVSYLAASIPVIIGVLYYIQAFYLHTSRQLRYIDLEARAPLYTHFTETAAGLEHIRCFGWEEEAAARNVELLEHSQKPFYHMYAIQRWLTLIMDLTSLSLAVIMVCLVLKIKDMSTPEGFGFSFLNIITLGSGMTNFIEKWTDLETSLGAISRLRTFIKKTPVEKGAADCGTVPDNWPEHGHIVMNQVCASYSETNDFNTLQNVSLNFRPGKKAVIIGRTGSGKSTLISTILGLLDYTGSIQIDGVELSRVVPDILRSRITIITQDNLKLDSSVRDNITPDEILLPSEERTQDAIIFRALAQVGLSKRFAGRLDKPMMEIGLSAGQQQQLNIARAIIHHKKTNSKIVLMDEPTSSMGISEEVEMQEVMANAFSSCTVVTVTHWLEAIENRQIVVEMQNGRIIRYDD